MGAHAERRPLRVLHAFATFVPAGPQLRTLDLIAGLGEEFEHEIIACDDELSARHSTPEGCRYTCLPCPEGGGPLGGVRAWRALLSESKPDLLLTYNWGSFDAVLAARSLGVGHHIHHEEGFNADEAQGQLRRRVWARRLGLGRIARLVVPSHLLKGVAKDQWKVDPAKVQLVLNGVCTERFRSSETERARIRAELGLTTEDLLLGSVGHLRPIKRYDRLLRSVARMRAGEGGEHLANVFVCLEQAVVVVPDLFPHQRGVGIIRGHRHLGAIHHLVGPPSELAAAQLHLAKERLIFFLSLPAVAGDEVGRPPPSFFR